MVSSATVWATRSCAAYFSVFLTSDVIEFKGYCLTNKKVGTDLNYGKCNILWLLK